MKIVTEGCCVPSKLFQKKENYKTVGPLIEKAHKQLEDS